MEVNLKRGGVLVPNVAAVEEPVLDFPKERKDEVKTTLKADQEC